MSVKAENGTSADRPFRILGLQQVAIGGPDLNKLEHLWSDVLGVAKVGQYSSVEENVDEVILQVGEGSAVVEIDLMQPLDPSKGPKVDSPPLNHIGLWVDDLGAALDWLSDRGVRFAPGGIRVGAGGHDICFIHPKGNEESPLSGEGVLIELVQAPPSML